MLHRRTVQLRILDPPTLAARDRVCLALSEDIQASECEAALQVGHTAHARRMKKTTIEPITAGDFSGFTPEFGRFRDVERCYGVKRGTAYNLLRDGKIKGVLLRVRGKKSGVRLISMQSVREFINSMMTEQNDTTVR